MIRKEEDKFVVRSEKTGKSLGSYSTKKEAVERLQQVEYFKHRKSQLK